MNPGGASEYDFCKRFRRWAKRAGSLTNSPEGAEEDQGRNKLLEEIWEFGAELYVWGTADHLARVLCCLYRREDRLAVRLLRDLADEELKALQDSGDGEEDREEGSGPSE